MVDKNNGGQARHKDGGQALDLLTIALKTDSDKPMPREFCKSNGLGVSSSHVTLVARIGRVRVRAPRIQDEER